MSIFSRRKIEIDPDDHELVKSMSAQSSDTTLFQTQTINITKISQDGPRKQASAPSRNQKSKGQHFKPSKMSDSFMPSIHQKKSFPSDTEDDRFDLLEEETLVRSEVIRPLDAKVDVEEATIPIVNEGFSKSNEAKPGITSELDQKELTDYMHKTDRINRVMVSLIIGAIVVVVIIIIVILILNLGKSGQTSPLGGV